MKIKKLVKYFTTLFTISMMILGLMGLRTAKAFTSSIDFEKKGTIALQKNDNNKNPLKDVGFKVYQIMTLMNENGKATYTVVEDFKDTLKDIKPDELGNYSALEIEALSKELADKALALETQPAENKTNAEGQVTIKNLDLGYYLVVETSPATGYVAASPFLVALPRTTTDAKGWLYGDETAALITVKNTPIGVEKEAQEDSIGEKGIVHYTITSNVPNYEAAYFKYNVVYKIYDKLPAGLTFNNDIKVKVDGNTVEEKTDDVINYTITQNTAAGNTFEISFTKEFLQNENYKGKTITVSYTATANEQLVVGSDGNKNVAGIEYNHKPGDETTKLTDDDRVYSFGIKVEKFTEENEKVHLEGATFELWNNDKTKVLGTSITDENGLIIFDRLDEGTYYLVETKAPDGYTLLANPIKVTITQVKDSASYTLKVNDSEISKDITGDYVTRIDDGYSIVAVENYKGFTLPATGGMGIALFLLAGGAGLITLFVVMKKREQQS